MAEVNRDKESHSTLHNLRDGAQRDVEALVEFELGVEGLAEDKAALLGSYIREDIHSAGNALSELKNELEFMENRAGQWLLSAADQTAIDWHNAGRRVVAVVDSRAKPAGALVKVARDLGIKVIDGFGVIETVGKKRVQAALIAPLNPEGTRVTGPTQTLACDLIACSGVPGIAFGERDDSIWRVEPEVNPPFNRVRITYNQKEYCRYFLQKKKRKMFGCS